MNDPTWLSLLAASLFTLPLYAGVPVNVSPEYRAIHFAADLSLAPNEARAIDLPLNAAGDRYAVAAKSGAKHVSFVLIDGRDRDTGKLQPAALRSVAALQSFIDIQTPPSSSGLIGVFVNRNSSAIKAKVRVDRIGERPDVLRAKVAALVAVPFAALDDIYELPQFTVTVKPCGEINAFSSPNITLCTELFADLTDKGLSDALHPILLHEAAHTLLKLWDLPGFDNEDMADEFAASMLARVAPHTLKAYMRWFEQRDSVMEAVMQLQSDERHTISIQRARNMQRIIDNPDVVARRWNKLLRPFERKQNR